MQRNNKDVTHTQAKKKQSSESVYVLGDLDVAPNIQSPQRIYYKQGQGTKETHTYKLKGNMIIVIHQIKNIKKDKNCKKGKKGNS